MAVRAAVEPERRNSWGAFFARLHESAVDGTLLDLDEKSIRALASEWLSAAENAADFDVAEAVIAQPPSAPNPS
jgi:hypothetical protein